MATVFHHNNIASFARSSECTACMACFDTCPHAAISYTIDRNGFLRMSVDSNRCTGCGACRKSCPGLNGKRYGESEIAKAFAGWNNDEKQRQSSASGGVFAALATYVLQSGGLVYGAAIHGFEIKHIRVNNLENLHNLQNSKYQHSITAGVYNQVKKDLKQGKTVLFSGLGCQIAALYAYLHYKPYDNLYTVDTICGGLSSMLPMISLASSGKYSDIISFRDKDNGWKSTGFTYRLKLNGNDGSVKDLGCQNIVLKCFSTKITKRASCLNCRFVGFKRQSDCTIGDFWGDTDFTHQHSNGLSSLIVHSERMYELLQKADLTMSEIKIDKVASRNPNLYFGNSKGVRRLISRHLAFFFLRNGLYRLVWPLVDYDSKLSIEMQLYGMLLQSKAKKDLKNQLELLSK
ncbi:Coenzyme F420 hydrogenase/dehydrogenase, beta subunit C-terminal domain [Akkermansia sp. N21116]|jgi:coenzyme F420-reducing hydrogenase beta subunit|uniref:Coenzyme F420 hydrogenase/dehydrogenase, beta subunit C-terminal domain n=1 Tax=Akkermansia sp. N21116 TaxID=3040764 RepID=UPI00244EA529|nr:Coenzyme F420 hydrogenase/dehydrogenase, beta subunit C-terminal domain [Akkermansia sp. N21116]WPX41448.1 Coenzyme F420 hydrogenase/dehydrogenase, beta subunit C-terminal domain [Akkermansia sp. N21116]